jgi:transporter family protein
MFPSWLPLALASAFFAALVAIFGKLGLDKVDTTLATTVRAAVMLVVLTVVTAATGRFSHWSEITGQPLLFIILAGLAGALSWLCYFLALRIGRTAQVAAIDRLSLVFVVLLAVLFLGERFTWKIGLGAAIMTVGAIITVL